MRRAVWRCLGGCLEVGDKPLVDERAVGAERRCQTAGGPPSLRWARRGERLADRAAVDAVACGEGADREALPIVVASDLFEQLHSGSHSFCDLRLGLSWNPDGRVAVGRGGASSSHHGGAG